MYRRIEDFAKAWAHETQITLRCFESLKNADLKKSVSDDVRNVGRLAWHITQTVTEMPHSAGLTIEKGAAARPVPETMQEIIDTYTRDAQAAVEAITSQWNDEVLEDKVEMYGMTWRKGIVLQALLMHQAHHRGQLSVLMRLLGVPVPGIYGPSKEEWSKYGAPAPAI